MNLYIMKKIVLIGRIVFYVIILNILLNIIPTFINSGIHPLYLFIVLFGVVLMEIPFHQTKNKTSKNHNSKAQKHAFILGIIISVIYIIATIIFKIINKSFDNFGILYLLIPIMVPMIFFITNIITVPLFIKIMNK